MTSLTTNTTLGADQIRALIPHAGSMCLLDRVIAWSEAQIECVAESHRSLDNPLRHNDQLPIHVGIEYCAQAIAVHGGLTSKNEGPPRRGFLAVIMNTEWSVDRLDHLAGPLHVHAIKKVVLAQGVQYEFAIKAEGHTLLSGQTVVALE